jgi:hypothetical protein
MLAVQGVVYAQIGPDPQTNARQSRIVGLWDVEVNITNCVTDTPLFSFLALHKYELGGTGQIVPSTSPTSLSAHMMIWSHVGGNAYQAAIKMFRYDAAGNFIGWVVVNNEVSINENGDEYVGSGVADNFDASGNYLGSACPEFVGTRFTGE